MPLSAALLANLIESQAATLRLWVRSRCASPEDVVQEAFCRLAATEPVPQNPVAWLYRVCRNLAARQRLSDQRRHEREQTKAKVEAQTANSTNSTDPLEIAET